MIYIRRHWKILALLFILLIIGVTFLVTNFSKTPLQSPAIPPFFGATPTPFSEKNPLIIVSTTATNSADTSIVPDISFTFSRPLTENEKASTMISLSPQSPIALIWAPDNNSVLAQLNEKLQFGQNYQGKIRYGNTSYSWSFTTSANQVTSVDEQRKLQGLDDQLFANQQKETQARYPWLDFLPISSPDYYVYFDLTRNSFFGTIYGSLSIEQSKNIQTQVENRLRGLVPNFGSYTITWSAKS